MHEAIVLNVWPSSLNCLSWSHDCILSVAAGETVELLIPELRATSGEVETALDSSQQWTNVHIRTNLFTSAEVPVIDPLGSRVSSIGEEISTSDVAAMEWSPPGLAKHSRCALAVLTTNLTLSIWVSDSDPKVARSWKRVLILNQELERYCQRLYGDEDGPPDLEWESRRRMRRRIRSFSWSPQMRPPQASGHSIKDGRFPVNGSFLAVSNDYNDVVILRIQSPYEFFRPSATGWSAHAVAHFSLEPKIDLQPRMPPVLFAEHMSEQRYISNLAWSPWSFSEDGVPEALLAYTTNEKLHLRHIRIPQFSSDVFLGQSDVFSKESIGTRTIDLVRWMPKMFEHRAYLVVFSHSGAVCCEVSITQPAKNEITEHDLDNRWDLISGCAFSDFHVSRPKVQFTSHMSATTAPTTTLSLPIKPIGTSARNPSQQSTYESEDSCGADNELGGQSMPPFQQSIRDSETLFSAENELGGHVSTKTWGLCSSPMGDLVASAVSFHPGDMVDYTISAASRTNIGIQPFRIKGGDFSLPENAGLCPVEDLSAEALLYSAKSWLENKAEADVPEDSVRETILNQIWKALGLSASSRDVSSTEHAPRFSFPDATAQGLSPRDQRLVVQTLRRNVYLQGDVLKRRYGRLLTYFFDPKTTSQFDDVPAIRTLVAEVLKLPVSCYNDSQESRKIRSIYAAMSPWLGDAEQPGMDGAVETSAEKHVEQCEICDDSIGFESFSWARCGQGHEFVRCSLTFLAIQAPGISKLCGICGKRYLSEQHIARNDQLTGSYSSAAPISTQEVSQDVAMQDAATVIPAATEGVTADENQGQQTAVAKQGALLAADERSPITLARMLFAACDVCIYCGGKFVG